MKIRKAKLKDKEELINVMIKADERNRNWAETRVGSYLDSKNKHKLMLVAEYNEMIVGYVGLKKYEDDARTKKVDFKNSAAISWIGVLNSYRKKGIGSKLLKSCDKYAKKFGKKAIWLDCRKEVLLFYEKNGYFLADKFKDEKNKLKFVLVKRLK